MGERRRRWQYYDLAFGPVRTHALDLYEALFCQDASRPVRDVLELGCGTGRWLIALGGRGYRMTGVDFDAAALALAREKCRERGVEVRLINQDLASWIPDDSYDAVIAPNNTLKWMPSHDLLRRCLTQAAFALRSGGSAIFDLSVEAANWKSLDWGTEADMEEHAWVSKFEGPGVSGEYRCFSSVPNLDKAQAPFVERFVCRDHGEEIAFEERTTWLWFSAGELTEWVSETGLLENAKFYNRGTHTPTEVGRTDLEEDFGQYLLVCRRC